MERWRKTSCGPEHDVLAGTHDVLAGDCQIGDFLEIKVNRSIFDRLDFGLTFN